MKKKMFVLLAAVVLMVAMTACGGTGDAKVYAGFYSAEIPAGFTVYDEYETEFNRDSESYPGETETIDVYVSTGSAEEEIQSSLEYWGDSHGRSDDVTYGDITWKVETFTWNEDAPSCTFYTDTEDGHFIEVNFFMMAHDSEEVAAMMETFTFEEGAYDKNYDFCMEILEAE